MPGPSRRCGTARSVYFELPPASGDMPVADESVLDESVLLELFAGGDVAVPSPLVPGVLADPLED